MNVALTHLSGFDAHAFTRIRQLHPQEIFGQFGAETGMGFLQARTRMSTAGEPALIDPLLHFDVRACFKLEVALDGVVAKVVAKGSLNVDRMSVMAFDEIAVIAIHSPNEVGQCSAHALGKAAAKGGCLRSKINGKIAYGRQAR
ncbi:hypothetical protein [Novosphingobium sp. Gsoil 351]|uniref:hypothetical protein n=1 Tax=Novosphingobium sp. Gsoil 351 TaxID=2675225 RepID=UPI001E3ADCCC|nr:hypothetical protein [Novosphingobium sp. Gsoil 351]